MQDNSNQSFMESCDDHNKTCNTLLSRIAIYKKEIVKVIKVPR